MKMVKSLLLGTAAGLIAVTAGQAADLPVKAKPVQYVKVCSLYGAGFYYMPGTDMCVKIGGWVRSEATWGNDNSNMTWGPYSGQENTRATGNLVVRERGYFTADAREQTAYGTARAYIDVGISDSTTAEVGGGAGTFSSNRAFLQWAGLTTGLVTSFYDFYNAAAVAYRAAFLPIEDTGDGGNWVFAYTAQLGNGVTATLSAEARRNTQILLNQAGAIPGAFGTLAGANNNNVGYGGNQTPDVVANIRADQAWGSAQIMGALHQLNATYYDPTTVGGNGFGHPGDEWGWVAGAGLKLNFPMIAQGDYFQGEFNVTEGALRYLNQPTQGNYEAEFGNTATYGILSDCVYGATSAGPPALGGTSCQKTSAWSVNLAYEHYWTPQWHQSFVGAYERVTYNNQANAILCDAEGGGNGSITGTTFNATAGCGNNWSTWGASTRLQWDVTKSFYLGVEILYAHMNSASSFNGILPATLGASAFPAPGPAAGAVSVGGSSAENTWAGTVRVHKDFLP